MRRGLIPWFGADALLIAGCAEVNPGPGHDRVDRQVEAVGGQAATYRPGDEPAAQSRDASLLEGGLTVDSPGRDISRLNDRFRAQRAGRLFAVKGR